MREGPEAKSLRSQIPGQQVAGQAACRDHVTSTPTLQATVHSPQAPSPGTCFFAQLSYRLMSNCDLGPQSHLGTGPVAKLSG